MKVLPHWSHGYSFWVARVDAFLVVQQRDRRTELVTTVRTQMLLCVRMNMHVLSQIVQAGELFAADGAFLHSTVSPVRSSSMILHMILPNREILKLDLTNTTDQDVMRFGMFQIALLLLEIFITLLTEAELNSRMLLLLLLPDFAAVNSRAMPAQIGYARECLCTDNTFVLLFAIAARLHVDVQIVCIGEHATTLLTAVWHRTSAKLQVGFDGIGIAESFTTVRTVVRLIYCNDRLQYTSTVTIH